MWLVESADRAPQIGRLTKSQAPHQGPEAPQPASLSPPLPPRSLCPGIPAALPPCATCPPPGFPLAGPPAWPALPRGSPGWPLHTVPFSAPTPALRKPFSDHLSTAAPSCLTSFLIPRAQFRAHKGVCAFVYCYTDLPGGVCLAGPSAFSFALLVPKTGWHRVGVPHSDPLSTGETFQDPAGS